MISLTNFTLGRSGESQPAERVERSVLELSWLTLRYRHSEEMEKEFTWSHMVASEELGNKFAIGFCGLYMGLGLWWLSEESYVNSALCFATFFVAMAFRVCKVRHVLRSRHEALTLAFVSLVVLLTVAFLPNLQNNVTDCAIGITAPFWMPYLGLIYGVLFKHVLVLASLYTMVVAGVITNAGVVADFLKGDPAVTPMDATLAANVYVAFIFALCIVGLVTHYQMELMARRNFALSNRLKEENVQLQIDTEPFSLANVRAFFRSKSSTSDGAAGADGGRNTESTTRNALSQWDIKYNDLNIGTKIASGGSGQVFEGELFGQKVAVKELFASLLTPDDLEEFSQECRMLSRLRHPHVVQFLGISVHEERIFLVTEFCPFKLDDVLAMPDAQRPSFLKLARELAASCQFVQANGIVHRDLKPDNVLLNEGKSVKLCDFGLARVTQGDNIETGVGTPQYMAPEMWDTSNEIADPSKIDVFSFGVLLWALYTRQRPYDDLNGYEVMERVANQGLRPEFPPGTPSRLVDLATACWQADPSRRPTFDQITALLNAPDFLPGSG